MKSLANPDGVPEPCWSRYEAESKSLNSTYCPTAWDNIHCWPPTPAGKEVIIRCPPEIGFDTRRFAVRICGKSGHWLDEYGSENGSENGWSNFTDCGLEEVKDLWNAEDIESKVVIAIWTRKMEMIGYGASFLAVAISLIIFFYFRALKNHRTHIHKNLLLAILIQIIVRMVIYIDRDLMRGDPEYRGVHHLSWICKSMYVMMEYARTAMFMWFFVEGFYLNQVVGTRALSFNPNYKIYYSLGWGLPVIITIIWTIVTSIYMEHSPCWSYYNLTYYFWIMEGPRLAVLFANVMFLISTIRILVDKLSNSASRKAKQIMKTAKALLFLLPLLGIGNLLQMTSQPIRRSVIEFGIWAIVSHFLTSFQGFFISLCYCFLNKEVRTNVMKHWKSSVSQREGRSSVKQIVSRMGTMRRTSTVFLSVNDVAETRNI